MILSNKEDIAKYKLYQKGKYARGYQNRCFSAKDLATQAMSIKELVMMINKSAHAQI